MERGAGFVMLFGLAIFGLVAAALALDMEPNDKSVLLTVVFGCLIGVFTLVVTLAELSFQSTVRTLRRVTQAVLPPAGPLWESTDGFDSLEDALRGHRRLEGLADAVREIREATFRQDDGIRNVFQASDFVDPVWFRATAGPPLVPAAVVGAAPGLLTAIGILGTFIGLVNGLPESAHFDNATLGNLLAGLKVSFWTSVMGLATSMFVTLISRTVEGISENVVDTFVSRLDARLRRGTSQELLWQVLDQQRQGTSQLKTLNTDLAAALEDAVQTISDQHVVPAFQRLEEHSDAMRQVATELAQGAAKEQVEGVGRIVDQVVDQMEGVLGSRIKEAAEALTAYAEQQNATLDRWAGSIAELDAATRRYEAAVVAHEQLTTRLREVIGPALEVGDRNRTAIEGVRTTMEGLEQVSQQAQQLTGNLAEAAADYRRGAEETVRTLRALSGAMDQTLAQWQTVVDGINGATRNLNDGMVSFVDGFPRSIEGVMVKFDDEMAKGVQRLASSTARLQEVVDELGDNIERALTGQRRG